MPFLFHKIDPTFGICSIQIIMSLKVFYSLHEFVSPEYKQFIETNAKIVKYKTGEYIKHFTNSKEIIYFIMEGLVKTFDYDKKDRQRIKYVACENQMCFPFKLMDQTEGFPTFVQCIEATMAISMPKEALNFAIANFNEANIFYNKMELQVVSELTLHIEILLIEDRTERVQKFQKAYKHIAARMDVNDQASFINMSRSTFLLARNNNLRK